MHHATTSRRPRAGAFTLIELLTVIAIIGILAAIIIPTVSKVRQTARASQCANNVRQWAQAIQLYAQENKGAYTTNGWAAIDTANPYTRYFDSGTTQRSLRICPFTPENAIGPHEVNYTVARPRLNATTAENGTLPPEGAIPLHRAANPSQLLLVLDRDGSGGSSTFSNRTDLSTAVRPLFQTPATSRHGGGAIPAAFADGHVAKVVWTAGANNSLVTNGDQWTRLN